MPSSAWKAYRGGGQLTGQQRGPGWPSRATGSHKVSPDQAIKTMREPGRDMKVEYKEISRGGLAVNVIEC